MVLVKKKFLKFISFFTLLITMLTINIFTSYKTAYAAVNLEKTAIESAIDEAEKIGSKYVGAGVLSKIFSKLEAISTVAKVGYQAGKAIGTELADSGFWDPFFEWIDGDITLDGRTVTFPTSAGEKIKTVITDLSNGYYYCSPHGFLCNRSGISNITELAPYIPVIYDGLNSTLSANPFDVKESFTVYSCYQHYQDKSKELLSNDFNDLIYEVVTNSYGKILDFYVYGRKFDPNSTSLNSHVHSTKDGQLYITSTGLFDYNMYLAFSGFKNLFVDPENAPTTDFKIPRFKNSGIYYYKISDCIIGDYEVIIPMVLNSQNVYMHYGYVGALVDSIHIDKSSNVPYSFNITPSNLLIDNRDTMQPVSDGDNTSVDISLKSLLNDLLFVYNTIGQGDTNVYNTYFNDLSDDDKINFQTDIYSLMLKIFNYITSFEPNFTVKFPTYYFPGVDLLPTLFDIPFNSKDFLLPDTKVNDDGNEVNIDISPYDFSEPSSVPSEPETSEEETTGNVIVVEPDPALPDIMTDDFDPEKYKISDDLSRKFPFCLPWDLYDCIAAFESDEIKEPVFDLTLGTIKVSDQEIDSGTTVVDLTKFDKVFKLLRELIFALFVFGLVLVTRKLISH